MAFSLLKISRRKTISCWRKRKTTRTLINCKVFVKTKNSQIVQIGSLQDLDALPLPGDVPAGGDATSTPARTRDEVTQPHRRGQGRRGRGSVRGGSRRAYRRRGPGSSNRPPPPAPSHGDHNETSESSGDETDAAEAGINSD